MNEFKYAVTVRTERDINAEEAQALIEEALTTMIDTHEEYGGLAVLINTTELRAVITLWHSDEVSGMTIFSDGTKAYWTEGRSSDVKFRWPDGSAESIGNWELTISPYMTILHSDDYGAMRQMTPEEERELAHERGWDER